MRLHPDFCVFKKSAKLFSLFYLAFLCTYRIGFLAGILLFSNLFSESLSAQESLSEQNRDQKIVNSRNWQDHAQYIFEPLAKLASVSTIEFAVLNKEREPTLSVYTVPTTTITTEIFTKYALTPSGIMRFDSQALLLWDTSRPELSTASLHFTAPDYIKNWFYQLDISSNVSSMSMYTQMNMCRTVHYENMHDEILGGSLSLDDIFMPLLGNAPLYRALFTQELVANKKMYIPDTYNSADSSDLVIYGYKDVMHVIDSLNAYQAKLEPAKQMIEAGTPKKRILLNSSQVRFAVSEKNVEVYKRTPVSPYVDLSHDIIAIDPETKIPYIKLIYGVKGGFLRGVMYYWSEVTLDSKRYLIPSGLISFDKQGTSYIEMKRVHAFEGAVLNFAEAKKKLLCEASKDKS